MAISFALGIITMLEQKPVRTEWDFFRKTAKTPLLPKYWGLNLG